MTPEDYKWHINLVKDRHHALDLSFEQAEQIYQYEQDKDTYSQKHYFSVWEEWDYEISSFRQILTAKQLEGYEEYMNQNIKRHEQWLIEQDKEGTNEIAYNQELLTYYENEFLPDLFKDTFIFSFPKLHTDKIKIEFLKSEYRVFLNDRKKQILTEHFRHNRLFKPNELKAALLRHKLSYLWPDYSFFKHSCDEATRAVIDYVKKTIKQFPEQTEKLLSKKIDELKIFNDENFKKYHSDTRGWHVIVGQLTAEEEKEHRVMTLLLLDNEKYGC